MGCVNVWVYNWTWNIAISHCPTGEGRSSDSSSEDGFVSHWVNQIHDKNSYWIVGRGSIQRNILTCVHAISTYTNVLGLELASCWDFAGKGSDPFTRPVLEPEPACRSFLYRLARNRTYLCIWVLVFYVNQVLIFARHASVTLHRKLKLYVFFCI